MTKDDIIRNGLHSSFMSNHIQEGVFIKERPTRLSQGHFAFDLGWFSKNGKPNMIAMYCFGDTAFRVSTAAKTGDILICQFFIDSFKHTGYIGVRGILHDFRLYGRSMKTAQYLNNEFEKSVTNTLSSGDEVRDISDIHNY